MTDVTLAGVFLWAALIASILPAARGEAPPASPAAPPPERSAAVAKEAAASKDSLRGWKSLTLKTEPAGLYSGSATLEISQGKHEATGREAVILKTRSEVKLLGAIGFEESTTSWIDAEARRPIELFHSRPGESARRVRFEPGRIVQTSWTPPSGRPEAPFEQWREEGTTSRKPVFADGSPVPQGEWITDAYALLHLLRDIDPAQNTPRDYLVWKRRHIIRLRVTPGERRTRPRNVTDEASGQVMAFTLQERRLDLTPSGEEGAEVRGLMGMQGGLEMWIDESSGAPVELRGAVPALGPAAASLVSFRR